jgi:subtilisin-like proprotein convertase family protein
MNHRFSAGLAAGLMTLFAGAPALAIAPAADSGPRTESVARTPARAFAAPELDALPSLSDARANDVAVARLAPFQARYGGTWEVRWDDRGNRPNVVQGSGVPLIPGHGNTLTPQAFGVAHEADLNLGAVAAKAREFVDSAADLIGTDGIELQLDAERSLVAGGDRPVWFVEFGQYRNGVRVDGAFVYVRIAQGNVVQFGAERIADIAIDTTPSLTREAAFQRAWDELGFPAGESVGEFLERGELRIYPALPSGDVAGESYNGAKGAGYTHLLAWRYVFRLPHDDATWQIIVDAKSNRVVDVRDLTVNVDAKVSGGVFPTTNTDPEVVVDFPFAAVTNSGAKITDALGIYDYSGGTATVTLDGKYFRMSDNCGAISLANTTTGNLAFGTSAGTDCVTPGIGGAGNTHASRSGFYHLTKINQKARTFLPTNTWLQGKVTANMNITQTCNASYNGQLNFYRSGNGCSNTGEIAAVFLHEWGHGMDSNSGGAAPENGSGEAIGDTFAFLETRDSCIGQNFKPGVDCGNCVNCTGVRDVGDFGVSAKKIKRASPANLTNDAGINCDRYIGSGGVTCPYVHPSSGAPYRGPMGYEGHCESLIASGANWDLTQALIARHGADGWSKMDRIWYSSLTPSKSAYQVAAGGQCNTAATVNGCGATNWYTVFLPADDDDGNLANGTPNACRIWDAFNAHGIACGARPECSGDPADFRIEVTSNAQAVCAPTSATFNVAVGSDHGFSAPVTLSASGNPAGTVVTFSPNPVTPGGTAVATVDTTGAVATAGDSFMINGTATGSPGHGAVAEFDVAVGTPVPPALAAPASGATGVDVGTALTWDATPGATSYTVEVASDAAFANIVATQTLPGRSWAPTGLSPTTTYWWRVRATGTCGLGSNGTARSFTTSNTVCISPALAIPDNNTTGATSTLTFASTTAITGLKLKIKTTHTYVADLRYTLTRGAASSIVIDQPGIPASSNGCDKPNIDVVLDDAATTPVENLCSATSPALGGTAKPNNPLDTTFGGGAYGGTWSLKAVDVASGDAGSLTQWCIEPKLAAAATYAVGGTVSGMTGTGLALSLNGGANFVPAGNGAFTFPQQLAAGTPYTVTIAAQPTNPADVCTIAGGSGTVGSGPVTNVVVTCVDRIFGDTFEAATP